METNTSFASYTDFETALNLYQDRTFQLFSKGRTKKLTSTGDKNPRAKKKRSPTDAKLVQRLVYESLELRCVHGGPRRHRGTGVRQQTHTRKIECPVKITVSARKRLGRLLVTAGPDINKHNHELSEENYKHERENRLLNPQETEDAVKLVQNGVAVRQMAVALRIQTKKPVREKDLHNLKSRIDRAQNPGQTEGDNVRLLLEEIRKNDPSAFIFAQATDNKPTQVIVIVTSEMRAHYHEYPEIVFIDATYRVNKQNYAMYLALVQDGNGLSQVVAAGWVASEKEDNIRVFVQQFKLAHTNWRLTRVIMLDKDFVEIKIAEEEFPEASVLLCVFHVIKAAKTCIARSDLLVTLKQDILMAFHRWTGLLSSTTNGSQSHFFQFT